VLLHCRIIKSSALLISKLLVSKYGIVADRSGSPEECTNITAPVSRTFNRYELFCQDDSTHGGTHLHALIIGKDYVEIVVMGVMLALASLRTEFQYSEEMTIYVNLKAVSTLNAH